MSQLIDFGSSDLAKVIELGLSTTLISDTAEPASPQITYTIQPGDLPPNINGHAQDFIAVLSLGGKNNDVATRQLTVQATFNGTNVDNSVTGQVAVSTSYWRIPMAYGAQGIQVGNTIGIKLWGNVAGQIDFRYATLYIVARKKSVPDVDQIARLARYDLITGGVSGVTYGANPFTCFIEDNGRSVSGANGLIAIDGCTMENGIGAPDTDSIGPFSVSATPALHGCPLWKVRVMDVK